MIALTLSLLCSAPFSTEIPVVLTAHEKKSEISVTAEGGALRIEDAAGKDLTIASGETALLRAGKKGLFWNEHAFRGGRLVITPERGAMFRLGKSRYRGKLVVEDLAGASLQAINRVGLEDYLRGVVGGEMPLDSPPQALAAQAVAARTYVLGELGRKKPIYDSVASQVYRGREVEDARSEAAVTGTAGLVLLYEGEPFLTYFHSTCGGHTGDPLPILGELTAPPLRGAACGYCSEKNSKYFVWELRLPFSVLDEIVRENRWGSQIQSLGPGSKDPWGRWTSVRLVGNEAEGRLRGDLFRMAVNGKLGKTGNLRSLQITEFAPEGDAYLFRGRGWGHGVGMCQIGAIAMAKLGFTFEQILARYYPGAKLENLDARKQ